MATRVGSVGTWNTTVGVKLDMDEMVTLLDPVDVPFMTWLPTDSTSSIKVEWMEENLLPQTATVASFTGTGPWTITFSDGSELRDGDVIHKVGAASTVQWVLSSVNNTANTAVATGFAGSSTAPVNADVMEIVGQYNTEGGVTPNARTIERAAKYNYTQILQERVTVTRTERKRAMYGYTDEYEKQLMKKFKEVNIRSERAAIHGQRTISGDSKQRFMGGFFFFISSNSQSNTKANAKTALNALLKQAYTNGAPGSGMTLFVSPNVKAAISDNVDPTSRRWMNSERVGGFVVDRYQSDFGEVAIVPNRHMPQTKGLLVYREYNSRVNYDPFFHELLAKTSDSDEGQVVGEWTLKVKNEVHQGILTLTDA